MNNTERKKKGSHENKEQKIAYTPRQSVIIKTPLRIALGGGGTDLPFYSKVRGGLLITAAIDEYISVSAASRPLDEQILLQTTSVQFSKNINDVENPLIRETLRYFNRTNAIQIASFSTLPTGIGLGSSSTLIVGIVNAISTLNAQPLPPMELAHTSWKIEREILGFAGGIQDQYIAALGGIQILTVEKNGKVLAEPLNIKEESRLELERRLVLVYSGKERDSMSIIKSQEVDFETKIAIYDAIKEIGVMSVDIIRKGDIQGLGEVMDEHWKLKKQLSKNISNSYLDDQYIQLKENGSCGGKIIGAGGGGFFMMAVTGNVNEYLKNIFDLGFHSLDWQFDNQGSHVIDQVGCHII
jgi:D-glycero-alpha-D-manno-heptose-7-phosphate kinase